MMTATDCTLCILNDTNLGVITISSVYYDNKEKQKQADKHRN